MDWGIYLYGDIKVEIKRAEQDVRYVYERTGEILNAIRNFRRDLKLIDFFSREELSKEELTFINQVYAYLGDVEQQLEVFSFIFGAVLGEERIPGRRGRSGKATLGIKELARLLRAFSIVDMLPELRKLENRLLHLEEKSSVTKEVETRLSGLLNQLTAMLRVAQRVLDEILDQIKEECKCKIRL